MEINRNSMEINRNSIEINGNSIEINGNSMEINRNSMETWLVSFDGTLSDGSKRLIDKKTSFFIN